MIASIDVRYQPKTSAAQRSETDEQCVGLEPVRRDALLSRQCPLIEFVLSLRDSTPFTPRMMLAQAPNLQSTSTVITIR